MYDASYKICRNVRWKDSTIDFEQNRIEKILSTIDKLEYNEYLQWIFSCFRVMERGKPRDIRACHIEDRLVQNAVCDNVLTPLLTSRFIYDNYATLQNRGIDFALKRAKKHLQSAQKEFGLTKDFYSLHIDVRKFFDNIDHDTLKEQVERYIKDQRVKNLIHYLIDTFCFILTQDVVPVEGKTYYVTKNQYEYQAIGTPNKFDPKKQYFEKSDKSLGLGSQVSQLLALLNLNDIDHYIKEQLHIKYYGRYMDDFYLIHNDKQYLEYCKDQIEQQLKKIHLEYNKNKTTIVKIHPITKDEPRKNPFKFLKWNFYVTTTNKVIQLPFKEKIRKERRTLKKMRRLFDNGNITEEDILAHYSGWRACMQKGNTFYLIQDMDNFFKQLFRGVEIV